MKVTNILWETDGLSPDELGLPTEVELPSSIDKDDCDAINDYLSDNYGWLVIDYAVVCKYEVYDSNDEVIDSTDDINEALSCAENNNAKFIFDTESKKVLD